MMRQLCFGLSAVLCVALGACGPGGVATDPNMPATTKYYVDALQGDDHNPGTAALPFRRITHALQVAVLGDQVFVQPGLYDKDIGEIFPLEIPDGVALIGDESTGAGLSPTTFISGSGYSARALVAFYRDMTVILGAVSTFAGFHVSFGDDPDADSTCVWIPDESEQAVIRACHVDGVGVEVDVTGIVAGYVDTHANIQNCRVTSCSHTGLSALGRCLIEGSKFHANRIGVTAQSWADLGGGAASSPGNNDLASNQVNLFVPNAAGGAVYAKHNTWDNANPTIQVTIQPPFGFDIWIYDDMPPGSVVLQ